MRTLIFGTSYVKGQEARYLFKLWAGLVTKLNPGVDVLVVDSASPDLPQVEGIEVLSLGDNIGHLGKGGRDGWGRAFCAGLRHAIAGQYEYVVHIECDVLFSRPVDTLLHKMWTHDVPIAAPTASPYSFVETALMFMNVGYVAASGLIERYDWAASVGYPLPEMRLQAMVGDDLFGLPLKGLRNDMGGVTAANMAKVYPTGIDWITHAEPSVYREFLRINEHG